MLRHESEEAALEHVLQAQALPLKGTRVINSQTPLPLHIQDVQACAEQPVRPRAQGRIRTSIVAGTGRGVHVYKKLTKIFQSAPIRQSAFQQRRNLSIHEWRSAQLLDSV
jgi:hypothetical protein